MFTIEILSSPVNWFASRDGFLKCLLVDGELLLGVEDLEGLRYDSGFSSNPLPGFIPAKAASSGGIPPGACIIPLASKASTSALLTLTIVIDLIILIV